MILGVLATSTGDVAGSKKRGGQWSKVGEWVQGGCCSHWDWSAGRGKSRVYFVFWVFETPQNFRQKFDRHH